MLMATALLNKRLLEIERSRAQNAQIKDPTPTLVDIERTHILNPKTGMNSRKTKLRLVRTCIYLDTSR